MILVPQFFFCFTVFLLLVKIAANKTEFRNTPDVEFLSKRSSRSCNKVTFRPMIKRSRLQTFFLM